MDALQQTVAQLQGDVARVMAIYGRLMEVRQVTPVTGAHNSAGPASPSPVMAPGGPKGFAPVGACHAVSAARSSQEDSALAT